mmetsp:Transcript_23538/g.23197  ORF Transcript_23538/g.23197 Transcript_23538/m.23197 type:complete len:343 (+) Transcript_23538:334-1362(+)
MNEEPLTMDSNNYQENFNSYPPIPDNQQYMGSHDNDHLHGVTDGEKYLKQEAQKAKEQWISDINKLHVEEDFEDGEILDPELEHPRTKKFAVTNPVKVSSHIKYLVTGEDDEGDFEQSRRFREFFALRQILVLRWPGIYIPSIPEKHLNIPVPTKSNDDEFIEERRSLLERFMKELSRFDYLVYSKEFKIFSRQQGDIEKLLNAQTKQSPMQILEKYRLNFKIDEEVDANAIQNYKNTIQDFQAFIRKVMSVMEIQKKQLKEMIKVRDIQDRNYKTLMSNLMKYEDQNVEYYSDSDLTKRISTHPSSGDMKEKMDNTASGWRNPYKDIYIWLKGELLDLAGI